jgi:uncharacterized membrane protein
MPLVRVIFLYFLTACVFFAVDMVWLGLIAKKMYRRYLGSFMSDKINWIAAVVFYLLFVVGILLFVVFPALEKESLGKAVFFGALFGLFTYATYDLTNLATLKDWPLPIVFIDILWGMILSGIVSTSGYLFARWLS